MNNHKPLRKELLPPIIYVYLGNKLPKYAHWALAGAAARNSNEVILLSNSTNLRKVSSKITVFSISDFYDDSEFIEFKESSKLDHKFRSGFWLHTAQRFFVLKQFCRQNSISKFFHAELDVMLFNLSGLPEKLDAYGQGIFIPRDSDERAIASLIYCNELQSLDKCCISMTTNAERGNEMALLSQFMFDNPQIAHALPSESTLAHNSRQPKWDFIPPSSSGGIFDAAAMGQWLFGIDPRNSLSIVRNHFVNENWHSSPEKLKFSFTSSTGKLNVASEDNPKVNINIYCLHIHSKINRKLELSGSFQGMLAKAQQSRSLIVSYNISQKIRYLLTLIIHMFRKIKNFLPKISKRTKRKG